MMSMFTCRHQKKKRTIKKQSQRSSQTEATGTISSEGPLLVCLQLRQSPNNYLHIVSKPRERWRQPGEQERCQCQPQEESRQHQGRSSEGSRGRCVHRTRCCKTVRYRGRAAGANIRTGKQCGYFRDPDGCRGHDTGEDRSNICDQCARQLSMRPRSGETNSLEQGR